MLLNSLSFGRGQSVLSFFNPLNSPANYTDLFVGGAGSYTNENVNKNFNATLNYNNTFGKFKTDLLVGYEYQSFDGSGNVTGTATIQANAVDSAEITAGAIDTAHITDDQVTYAKIQNVSADESC